MAISRQPIPGHDNGIWGSILNDYLSVSLTNDGSLKNGVVADAQIATNAGIDESKLSLASDAAAGTASRRTLGTGATQAVAGNDTRITGAEQTANKNQPDGYVGLDGAGSAAISGSITSGGTITANDDLDVISRVVRVGPTTYPAALSGGGASSAYTVIDKANTAADATLLLRDQGNIRAEIGLAGDNNIHFKTVTGLNDAEVFTDRFMILMTGDSWFVGKLGVGATPAEQLHVSATGTSARTLAKIENANAAAGTVGAGVQLAGAGANWTMGTDAGLNGNNNFFIQDNGAGYPPRLLIDATGNTAIGTDTAAYKVTVAGGDIAAITAGGGFRIKEGANAKMGVVTLVSGTAIVNTTAITSNSRVFLTIQTPGGTVGTPYVATRTASVSFTVSSTSGTDTSSVAWVLIEPS